MVDEGVVTADDGGRRSANARVGVTFAEHLARRALRADGFRFVAFDASAWG